MSYLTFPKFKNSGKVKYKEANLPVRYAAATGDKVKGIIDAQPLLAASKYFGPISSRYWQHDKMSY